jgi:hypothetical protein
MGGSMGFEEHPQFKAPADSNAKIWRYMDVTKYLSLLERKSLFFVRLDKLTTDDPFEGLYTEVNLAFDHFPYDLLPAEMASRYEDKETFDKIKELNKRSREYVKEQRTGTFVNSWHQQDHESVAMWSQYIRGADGIAVQSSYARLIDAMADYKDFGVFVGLIGYLDYATEAIPLDNLLHAYMHKRRSFEHERELRALIWTYQHGKNDGIKYRDVSGIYVPVNLDRLIENVYVSPTAPAWVADLVTAVTIRYGLDKEVRQSDLARRALY